MVPNLVITRCTSTCTGQPSKLDAAGDISRWRPPGAIRRMNMLSHSAHTQQ